MNHHKALAVLIFMLTWILVLSVGSVDAQQYFLYETSTLSEAGINPETEVFDKNACKRLAFNCFVPSVHVGGLVYGPARKFIYDSNLFTKISKGVLHTEPAKTDYLALDTRITMLSLKLRLRGRPRSEIMLDYSLRATAGISLHDGLFGLKSVSDNITAGVPGGLRTFDNYLNTRSGYAAYSQIAIGYRTNIDNDLSAGLMIGFLNGISGGMLTVNSSKLNYILVADPRTGQKVVVNGSGYLQNTQTVAQPALASQFNSVADYLPGFKHPGLNFSGGLRYRLSEQSAIAVNLKDLGFIFWNGSTLYNLNMVDTVGVSSFNLSKQLKSNLKGFFGPGSQQRWLQVLPTKIETSYTSIFLPWLRTTFIASKPVLSHDLYLTAISDLVYNNLHLIINTGYDTRNATDIGLHFLYRSRSAEFYIGSERLAGLTRLRGQLAPAAAAGKPIAADINFGFALKFGHCFLIQTATDMHLDGKRPGFFMRLFEL